MSVVLFAWELGGGMGHLMQMRPLVQGLVAHGHKVFLALRDLSSAHLAFNNLGVSLLQAPFHHRITAPAFPLPCTYAQIIADMGFADDTTLQATTAAWRNLYRLMRPDLIVFDHSPTALLAARGAPARTVVIGAGFFIPPDISPFPDLRQPTRSEPDRLRAEEQQILQRVNRFLAAWRQPRIERLGQLFSQASERFLMTFEELDHYPGRRGERYWGPVNASGGKAPEWPLGEGQKVYAYLKNFSGLPNLLAFLNERRLPTLIAVDGVDPRLQQRFASPTLRFERQRLDPDEVARRCDLAIMNGNHGTVTAMLLCGKATLQLPLTLEQGIIARHVRRLGAGLDASARKWAEIQARLEMLLSDPQYGEGAGRFAGKYTEFNPARQQEEILSRVLSLLGLPFRPGGGSPPGRNGRSNGRMGAMARW